MAACEELYHVIVGASLAALLAMMLGLMACATWHQLKRQLSRSGLVAFLICAGIATVEAQKTKYVDAHATGANTGDDWENAYTNLQTAVRVLTGIDDAGEIFVKPGTYGPIFVDADWLKGSMLLDPNTTIIGVEGPGKTIIDGGGVTNCYENFNDAEIHMIFEGLSFVNGKTGLKCGCDELIQNCIVSNCEVGVDGISWIRQSLIAKNKTLGVRFESAEWMWCMLQDSTVSDNGIGLQSSVSVNSFDHTIIWGNGIDCVEGENPYSLGDPCFVDAEHGDYHLRMGSPCIQTGNGSGGGYDLDGLPRVTRGAQDFGPYEYQPTNETQTITAPVPVEFAWIDEKCPALLASVGGDYDKAVLQKSANPIDISLPESLRTYYSIWESYVADLDPADSNATFRATIAVTNGMPYVKGDPESPNRRYTIFGKQTLTDEVWSASCPDPRFFKVKVELK